MHASLEGWTTKDKQVPSPHEVRLDPLDTNPYFNVSGKKIQASYYHGPFTVLDTVLDTVLESDDRSCFTCGHENHLLLSAISPYIHLRVFSTYLTTLRY